MVRTTSFTRREWLGTLGVGAAALASRAASEDEK